MTTTTELLPGCRTRMAASFLAGYREPTAAYTRDLKALIAWCQHAFRQVWHVVQRRPTVEL